ncbi:unnamed protein product [Effrenium voratum]|nr:unnamed protein product [Effrenium voratum]
MPVAPVQDYQVMCAACGTMCGYNYRFCSFCGNYLCEGMGGPVMMAYFQPADWQMNMTEQPVTPMDMSYESPGEALQHVLKPQSTKEQNKMPQADVSQDATEESWTFCTGA